MTSTVTELVRVTVRTPDRHLDVALPDRVAVAALLPVLLRGGGVELADRGAPHGGWVLRDVAGTALDTGRGLAEQGVRDGDLLCLGLADESWPELDYDDVVEAIAGGAGRRGGRWGGTASRVTSLVAAGVLLAAALAALWSGPRGAAAGVSFGLAAVLAAAAVVAARAYRREDLAPLLGAASALFAFAGGWWAATRVPGASGADIRLVVACTAVVVVAVITGLGVARPGPVFVAAPTAALFGLLGGAVGTALPPVRAAAVVLGVVALTSGLAPSLAARIGGLPRPEGLPRSDAAPVRALPGAGPAVDGDELFHAVARTDGALAGLLAGAGLAGAVAAVLLAGAGGWSGRLLVGAVAAGLALRARSYAGLTHRAVALAGAALAALPLLLAGVGAGTAGPTVAGALAAAALFTIIAGTGAAARSPYLGRLGDLVEIVSIASVVPLVCLVLGWYGRVRGMHL